MAIDFKSVTYQELTKKHPDREQWEIVYEDYRLLYEGGERFLAAAGQMTAPRSALAGTTATLTDILALQGRRRRFLKQLEGEPDVKYLSRWDRAKYVGYYTSIVDYFRHHLFSKPPIVKPQGDAELPDWFNDFYGNVDGADHNLHDFIKEVFLDVLLLRRAGWLIGSPVVNVGGLSQAEAEEAGIALPELTPYNANEIYDWGDLPNGQLDWIKLGKKALIREFPGNGKSVETYTYVDRQEWATWEVIRSGEKGEKVEINLVAKGTHGLGEVPFIALKVPEGLWVANKLASWQIDMFNKMSMLDYGQLVSCYLQPYLKSNDVSAQSRIFGEGFILQLANGNTKTGEKEEEFGWASPDVKPLEFVAEQMQESKDEGFRIVHQMSLAVDSAGPGTYGRSGESKKEDRRATDVILAAYGNYVREAIVRTFNVISRIQGEDVEWSCEGFEDFSVSSLAEELATSALIAQQNIPSNTFKIKTQTNLALRILDREDEETKEQVAKEIEDSITAMPDAVDKANQTFAANDPNNIGTKTLNREENKTVQEE